MIVGLGSDLVAVPRVAAALAAHGERFARRVYTPAEAAYCSGRPQAAESYAARFAAKEAFFKAVGVGWPNRGMRWVDVEVVRAASGAPSLVLAGAAAEILGLRGGRRVHLTMSHTAEWAMATVVLED